MTESVEALLKEISQLRRRLLYYEQHHRDCGVERPPSPPLDEDRRHIHTPQAQYVLVAPTAANNLHNTTNTAKRLEIVIFDPLSIKDIETKSEKTLLPRHEQWRTVANQLIDKVPHINEWTARRRILGLESDQHRGHLQSFWRVKWLEVHIRQPRWLG